MLASKFIRMGFASLYLDKHASAAWHFSAEAWPCSQIVVVIPCYNEPEFARTVFSLAQCEAPSKNVTVLVVINQPEGAPDFVQKQNTESFAKLSNWKKQMPAWLNLIATPVLDLPHKLAGAGYARKIGMDCAMVHFNRFDHYDGLLVSLDADCTVEKNYLRCIEAHFENHPDHIATTIYFEHPLDESPARGAITLYELSMRYYRNALAASGFPFAMYTVGSCFAVKAQAYAAQGGMNRRKAGEDFYFLHKLLPYGTIGCTNSTTVYPSARLSDRVPFGTGPLLLKAQKGQHDLTRYYPLSLFETLGYFFRQTASIYKGNNLESSGMHHSLFMQFCESIQLTEALDELRKNCASLNIFNKRFFHVFNAFMVLKWMHFALENGVEKTGLCDDAASLATRLIPDFSPENFIAEKLLMYYRAFDKAVQNT